MDEQIKEFKQEKLKDRISECIDDMAAAELVDLYNEYQRTAGNGILIYHMSQLASIMCYYDLFDDVKNSFKRGKFNPSDKYFIISDHIITSYYYIYDIDINTDVIVDFIVKNCTSLGNMFIDSILEEEGMYV